jgi:RHS repeat-associated protein
MTQYKFNVKTQAYVGNLTWNANGTLSSLGITDPFNAADTQSCSYAHDDLVRIASVNCGAATWQQTFSYDAFGNITKSVPTGGTGNSFQPTYSAATNRMTSLPSFTPTYDANGNVLTNSAHTYAWDAEGKHVSVDGTAYTYDALGRKVEIAGAGFSDQTFYLPDGSQVLFAGQVARRGNFNLPGGERVNYDSTAGGLLNYGHADHLGSLRLLTTPTQTYADSLAYAPFAETYAVSSQTTDQSFTGMGQAGGLDAYGFPARDYSNQGRWISPDPAGLAAVDPAGPQSWNRYAYVVNSPMILTDPSGLDPGGLTPGDICLVDDTEPVCGFPAQILAGNPGGSGGCTLNPFSTALVPICAPGVGGGIVVGIGGQSGGGTIPPIPVPNNPGTTFPGNPVGQQVCVQIGVSTVYCTSKPLPAWIIDLLADGEAAIIDARVNNLSQAVNSTGVQLIANPCFVPAFYLSSATLGAGGVAVASAPEIGATIAEEYPSLIHKLLTYLNNFRPRGTIGAAVGVIKAIPATCSQ